MEIWRKILHVDHLVVSAITLSVIGMVLFVTVNLEFLNPVVRAFSTFSMTDVYYRIVNTGEQRQMNDLITLVDMTELHHRDKIAELIDSVAAMNPAVMGVDIIFEGLKDNESADEQLTETFFSVDDKAIIAYKLIDYDPQTRQFGNAVHSFFQPLTETQEGFVNVMNNPEQSVRGYYVNLMLRGDTVWSLPALLARRVGASVKAQSKIHVINYQNVDFPVVSWQDLAAHRDLIEGHMVLLGTTKEENDMHFSPVGKMSGLHILAYATLSMMESRDFSEAGWPLRILVTFLICALVSASKYAVTWRLRNSKLTAVKFLTEAVFFGKIIYFIWVVLVTWVTLILYIKFNYYFDAVLTLAAIVLVGESSVLYTAIVNTLAAKYKWKWLRRSLFYRGE